MCTLKRIILVVIVLLIADVSSKGQEKAKKEWKKDHCECGLATASPNSIMGHEYFEKYPWLVNLMDRKNNMTTFCVGTIVSRSLVLTSASCMLSPQVNSTESCQGEYLKHCFRSRSDIAVGISVTFEPVTIFRRGYASVKKITPHSYSEGNFDEKLVLLSMSLPFRCADAAPVCLGTHKIVKTWTNGVMSGWKNEYFKREGVNETKEVQMDIVHNRQCSKIRGHRASKQAVMCPVKNESASYCKSPILLVPFGFKHDSVMDLMHVTSHAGVGGTTNVNVYDYHAGDAGAPVFVSVNKKFNLVGIMSKAIIDDNCEKHNVLPLICIDKYLKWIHKAIKKEEHIHSGKHHW